MPNFCCFVANWVGQEWRENKETYSHLKKYMNKIISKQQFLETEHGDMIVLKKEYCLNTRS